jgi:AraC-like DNA-binding protein
MELDLSWVNLIILFGALQGFIFALILFFNRNHPGAKFLSVFMFTLAYNGLETFSWSSGLSNHTVFFDLFAFTVIFAVGPSLYLYTTCVLEPHQYPSARKIILNYGIVAFQLVLRCSLLVFHILWINDVINAESLTPVEAEHWFGLISEPLSLIVFLVYFGLAASAYRKSVMESVTRPTEQRKTIHRWVRALLLSTAILSGAWVLTMFLPQLDILPYDAHYYPIEICLVFFIYWIAYVGYHRVNTIVANQNKRSAMQIPQEDYQAILSRLIAAMEKEKHYLEPELNLTNLATLTGIPAKTISSVINRYGKSFNEFVNEYRIRDVQQKLLAGESGRLTISAIAFESGFNSQATFQRAFRQVTGMSPKKYNSCQVKTAG